MSKIFTRTYRTRYCDVNADGRLAPADYARYIIDTAYEWGENLGLGDKVFVFGTDMNNQMGQMLQAKDDILQGVTGQAPYQMGYDSLAAALDVPIEELFWLKEKKR